MVKMMTKKCLACGQVRRMPVFRYWCNECFSQKDKSIITRIETMKMEYVNIVKDYEKNLRHDMIQAWVHLKDNKWVEESFNPN